MCNWVLKYFFDGWNDLLKGTTAINLQTNKNNNATFHNVFPVETDPRNCYVLPCWEPV